MIPDCDDTPYHARAHQVWAGCDFRARRGQTKPDGMAREVQRCRRRNCRWVAGEPRPFVMSASHVSMPVRPRWKIVSRPPDQPLVAVALHDGHDVRASARPYLALSDADRLHEEDPYTREWVEVAPHQVVVTASRFEVDLNREREAAVYRTPGQAWGLKVWREDTPSFVWAESLLIHDAFREAIAVLLDDLVQRHGHFVLFDLHTYNHRRDGTSGPPAAAAANPEINVGTRNLAAPRWRGVIEMFIESLRAFDFDGHRLDVRENVKFGGGAFSQWVAERYPTGCPLAIEVKKFFMDEWTAVPDRRQVALVRAALASTVDDVLAELARA